MYALFGDKAVMLHEQWRIMKVKNKKIAKNAKKSIVF